MSYTTKTVVTASQGQRDFDIPFPFLDVSHVKVRVAGNPATWSLVNSGRLRLDFAANAGNLVEISRQTAIDQALVQFNNGAVLTSEDLNKAVQQTLFIQQELTDLYTSTLQASLVNIATANGSVVTDPTQVMGILSQQLLASSALSSFNSRVADITANAHSLVNQQTQITGLSATVNDLASFNGTGLQTIINNEQTQRIAGDTALAQTVGLIGASSDGNASIVLNQVTCKVSPSQTLGDYITGVASQFGSVNAAIQTEATTRATADSAFATQFSLLGAKSANGQSWLLDESRVLVSGGTVSLANRLSGLDSSLGSNTAAIASEQTARAAADASLAQSVTNLTTTLSGHTASIATLQSVTNGLSARYSVALDVNGYVSGFLLNSTGTTSDFTVLADKFSICSANGAVIQTPFSVSNGKVYIDSACIGDATISSAKIADATITTLKMADGSVLTDKLATSAITKVYSFTNSDFVPASNPYSPVYMVEGAEYTICSGVFTKERDDSRLRIHADATIWSDNDITAQLFIRIRPSGGGSWTNLIGNRAYPAAYASAYAGWAYGELGAKLSDWGVVMFSDVDFDSMLQAVKTLFIDTLGAGLWEIAFVIRAARGAQVGTFSNHVIQPGAVISVEEIKR